MRRIARRDDTLLNNLTPTHSATALTTQSLNAPIYSLFYANWMGFRWHIKYRKLFHSPQWIPVGLLQNVQSFKIIIFSVQTEISGIFVDTSSHYVHDGRYNRDKLVADWLTVTASVTYSYSTPPTTMLNKLEPSIVNMCVNLNNNNFSSKCKTINQKRIVAPTVQ